MLSIERFPYSPTSLRACYGVLVVLRGVHMYCLHAGISSSRHWPPFLFLSWYVHTNPNLAVDANMIHSYLSACLRWPTFFAKEDVLSAFLWNCPNIAIALNLRQKRKHIKSKYLSPGDSLRELRPISEKRYYVGCLPIILGGNCWCWFFTHVAVL